MASISTDAKGNRRIFFTGPNRKRRIVYLGDVPMRTARKFKGHIEKLAAALLGRHAPDPDTSEWVGNLDDVPYSKLARVGLVPEREGQGGKAGQDDAPATLGAFIEQYIKGRTDIKPRTRINLDQARKNLVRFFGRDKPLRDIAPGDADDFRLDLMGRLSENTARRHCGRAKQFFRAAVRKRLIDENPFADMKGCGVRANASRLYFISTEEAQKVLDACPDAQWRLLFALSRYGGLRCPSEHLLLEWSHIDWERSRMTVHSPKTEHHEDKGSRVIPIFPELRPYLDEVWDEAEKGGSKYVITRYRDSGTNLRTQLTKIIERAGVKRWPKLWQNLRSTRETELAETYPLHVVCAWLGNSKAVAAKHYLQVTDAHFERAVTATGKPSVSADGGGRDAHSDARATQNPTQPISGNTCHHHQETEKAPVSQGFGPTLADDGTNGQMYPVPPEGLEPSTL